MNQQWLTILLSKGIELEQNLRSHFSNAKQSFQQQLESRGIRLSAADLAALIEEISPKASQAALSYALDVLRPFTFGMGLRVSRLADTHIEMVLPYRTRNQSEHHRLHEGALAGAAVEAAHVLWMRHAPVGDFRVEVSKLNLEILKSAEGDCRLRLELSEALREGVLAQLRQQARASEQVVVIAYDEHDTKIAEIILDLEFYFTPGISHSQQEKK